MGFTEEVPKTLGLHVGLCVPLTVFSLREKDQGLKVLILVRYGYIICISPGFTAFSASQLAESDPGHSRAVHGSVVVTISW